MEPRADGTVTGLDDPQQRWLEKIVQIPDHPEWGSARVLRWFPPNGATPATLRVFSPAMRSPRLVEANAVQVVEDRSEPFG